MGCNSSTQQPAPVTGNAKQAPAPVKENGPKSTELTPVSEYSTTASSTPDAGEPLLQSSSDDKATPAVEEASGKEAPAGEEKSVESMKDFTDRVQEEEKDVEKAVEEPLLDARTAVVSTSEQSPVKEYFGKFAGAGVAGPPRPPLTQTAFSWFGSFTGIAILGLLHGYFVSLKNPLHLVMLIPPFGAMAVLVFSACKAPLAQPRNVILGNTIGGFVGWLVFKAMTLAGMGSFVWITAALAVSLTIVAQEHARAVHPPGGATALAFVIVAPLHTLDFVYIFCPALLGAVILVVIGLFTNNLSTARTFPQGWGFGTVPAYEANPDDSAVKAFFKKFAGAGVEGPPAPHISYSGFSFMGSFLGIAILGCCDTYLSPAMPQLHLKFLVASFGAMAVLVYGQPKAPLAQPRNVILGNTIGGVMGVCVVKLLEIMGLGGMLWLNGALAVSLTIVLQELTSSVHPPGGATALVFVVLPLLRPLGFEYILSPACLGAAILLVIGLLTNNLSAARAYPQGWF